MFDGEKRLNQIPAQVIPTIVWSETLQYSFMKVFPSINIVPEDAYLMTRGREAGRSSAATQGRFLGRSGPAHNSALSQKVLVSLPRFPLG